MDDVIVSRDQKNWIMVCNASNREKLVSYFNEFRRTSGLDFDMSDQTESTAMVALQGPKVIDRVAGILPVDLKAMKRYHFETPSLHAGEIHRCSAADTRVKMASNSSSPPRWPRWR